MKITRRRFLWSAGTLGAAAGAAYLYASKYEPTFLEATHRLVDGLMLPRPLRVLHLSDLHVSEAVPLSFVEKALRYGINEAPDLVFITGDFITGPLLQMDEYVRILRMVSLAAPTYACLGNHDGGVWGEKHAGHDWRNEVEILLKRGGVQLLKNERVSLEYSHGIDVAGLGDLWNNECQPERCLERKTKKKGKGVPMVLLCHNPDARNALGDYGWDLMLAGHTHGGQFKVPIIGWRPFLPVEDRRIVAGLYTWQGRRIHVTRGIGNLHGLRFNCRPEISVLELS